MTTEPVPIAIQHKAREFLHLRAQSERVAEQIRKLLRGQDHISALARGAKIGKQLLILVRDGATLSVEVARRLAGGSE